jgi:PAS domain S-box-containing protein
MSRNDTWWTGVSARSTDREWPVTGSRVPDLVQVLEQSGEAVIVKDLDAVVTYWNREAASLYGFSAEEAIGQPLRKLYAAELSEADHASLLARVRAGRPTSSTSERRKKNGEIIRVTLKTTPLLDEQGGLIGEITIARDVTYDGFGERHGHRVS